ncbi:MAG TPA: hypothetical protein VGN69_06500 [Solirubrobacteraceae bacterium]|nr:hypothetical protein [Solirubrobacteraceae bacterium]
MNLLPQDRRSGAGVAGRSGGAVYLLLGGLAGLLLMGVMYVLASHQVADRRAQLAVATREADAAQARAAALAPYAQFSALRSQRLQAISMLASQRIDWPQHLRDVASALPVDVKLLTLDGTAGPPAGSAAGSAAPPAGAAGAPPAPAASGAAQSAAATATGPTVQLTGCASSQTQVADVINRLRAVPGVLAVNLSTSQKQAGGAAGSGSGGQQSCGDPNRHPQFALTVSMTPAGARAGAGGVQTSAPAASSAPSPVATSTAASGSTRVPTAASTGSPR